MQCNILEAKNQLSKLVRAVLAGEDVVIVHKGAPVVRLVKIGPQTSTRKPGAWSGLPKAPADWDSPATNADVAAALTPDTSL